MCYSTMNIRIVSNIGTNSKETVFANFDRKLFLQLAPPFPKLNLVRFDGCIKGNQVHLETDFILFKQKWISLIIENVSSENEIYFVDEGTTLPFPLKTWRHKHIVRQIGKQVEIEDNIRFSTKNKVADILLYLPLYLLFLYRKPVYKKFFFKQESQELF
jgi:ligand-binding SRPBCC domain-containing protein